MKLFIRTFITTALLLTSPTQAAEEGRELFSNMTPQAMSALG